MAHAAAAADWLRLGRAAARQLRTAWDASAAATCASPAAAPVAAAVAAPADSVQAQIGALLVPLLAPAWQPIKTSRSGERACDAPDGCGEEAACCDALSPSAAAAAAAAAARMGLLGCAFKSIPAAPACQGPAAAAAQHRGWGGWSGSHAHGRGAPSHGAHTSYAGQSQQPPHEQLRPLEEHSQCTAAVPRPVRPAWSLEAVDWPHDQLLFGRQRGSKGDAQEQRSGGKGPEGGGGQAGGGGGDEDEDDEDDDEDEADVHKHFPLMVRWPGASF
eukprot:362159-Chlamydomonas_euryale.AAC.14